MQLDCLSHWFPARLLKACNLNIVKRVGEVKQKQQIVALVLGALFKHSFSFTSFFLKKNERCLSAFASMANWR